MDTAPALQTLKNKLNESKTLTGDAEFLLPHRLRDINESFGDIAAQEESYDALMLILYALSEGYEEPNGITGTAPQQDFAVAQVAATMIYADKEQQDAKNIPLDPEELFKLFEAYAQCTNIIKGRIKQIKNGETLALNGSICGTITVQDNKVIIERNNQNPISCKVITTEVALMKCFESTLIKITKQLANTQIERMFQANIEESVSPNIQIIKDALHSIYSSMAMFAYAVIVKEVPEEIFEREKRALIRVTTQILKDIVDRDINTLQKTQPTSLTTTIDKILQSGDNMHGWLASYFFRQYLDAKSVQSEQSQSTATSASPVPVNPELVQVKHSQSTTPSSPAILKLQNKVREFNEKRVPLKKAKKQFEALKKKLLKQKGLDAEKIAEIAVAGIEEKQDGFQMVQQPKDIKVIVKNAPFSCITAKQNIVVNGVKLKESFVGEGAKEQEQAIKEAIEAISAAKSPTPDRAIQ